MYCIDLRERFGHCFQVVSEDGNRRNIDPWLWIIPCRHGHLYAHGGSRIGAATNLRRGVGWKIAHLPCVNVEQEAGDGWNLSFDVIDFAAVAELMRPNRRKRLGLEQKEKLVAAGRSFQFSAGQSATVDGQNAAAAA